MSLHRQVVAMPLLNWLWWAMDLGEGIRNATKYRSYRSNTTN